MEIQDFTPIIDNQDNQMRVSQETARGAMLVIVYEVQVGFKHKVIAKRSITRHVKRIGLDTFEYRWFERYLDIENKSQIAEYVAIYKQDGATASLVGVNQLRKTVSIKELAKAA